MYFSKTIIPAKYNYKIYNKEILVIIKSLKKIKTRTQIYYLIYLDLYKS
jgi:hypothetical protein